MKKVLFALMLITVAACNNTTETTSVDTTACDSTKCDTACVDTTVTLKADTTVTK
jgi:hypothetical protein